MGMGDLSPRPTPPGSDAGYEHPHHRHLSSIQKKDLIAANWMKAAWRTLHLGCPALRGPIMAGSKLFLPNRRHEPLPNYRDAELLRSATGSKSINSLPRWERPPGL